MLFAMHHLSDTVRLSTDNRHNTLFCSGDETGGETPVLIPNTAVKTSRGDGTAL